MSSHTFNALVDAEAALKVFSSVNPAEVAAGICNCGSHAVWPGVTTVTICVLQHSFLRVDSLISLLQTKLALPL